MPDTTVGADEKIGPNAILQLVDPVTRVIGPGAMDHLLTVADVALPTGAEMIPQQDVADAHRALWTLFPEEAHQISTAAGHGTAAYICTNRIPAPARVLLRWLPRVTAERALTRAIEKHAWTFCGSGRLATARKRDGITFALRDNPLVDPLRSDTPQCHWHTAVFAALFTALLGSPYAATETSCCGCGESACTFLVHKTP